MKKRRSLQRASFLIVRRCTAAAFQWETHQSCLLLQQNNIVTGATSAETNKFFLPKVEPNGTKVDTVGKMWTQSNKKCAKQNKNLVMSTIFQTSPIFCSFLPQTVNFSLKNPLYCQHYGALLLYVPFPIQAICQAIQQIPKLTLNSRIFWWKPSVIFELKFWDKGNWIRDIFLKNGKIKNVTFCMYMY